MPFTPFHFGPGLFGKSLAVRHFSWFGFIAAQIVIDCEPLYYHLKREYPVHHFFHTFIGATLAGLITGLLLIALLPTIRVGNHVDAALRSEFSKLGMMAGALFGGLSHPFLDGLMHADIRPFAPWWDANPLLGLVSDGTLHTGCIVFGVAGITVIAARLRNEL